MADGRKSRDVGSFLPSSRERESGRHFPLGRAEEPYTYSLLQHVFSDHGNLASEACASGINKAPTLANLQNYIEKSLEDAATSECKTGEATPDSTDCGRVGATEVVFDILTNVGTLIVEPDRLGLSSLSNFSTMKANCGVYKGKWIYELWLGSKGVMQLGWCTLNCKFSLEEGVGDTADSYAYDGSRLRKWNVKTSRYGEQWLTGDVISCAIDCDNGTVTFYRNGNSMGQAFSGVRRGPGLAYLPAISLSMSENLRANFGATPLRYPL
ncbi:hypothetical protein SNE40_013392 [Patella caerulea]|uniref:B30.2/SPRY domain-containing protein n=1 Tax=Patella caerulea TaxID=87958 RepID=A0AAN8JC78_PATCE